MRHQYWTPLERAVFASSILLSDINSVNAIAVGQRLKPAVAARNIEHLAELLSCSFFVRVSLGARSSAGTPRPENPVRTP